jgi:hypothetical protein
MKSAYHYDNTRRMYFLSISSPAITAREPDCSGSIQMKNCNFISAGAAAETYAECEKNEANLFHRRARALMASNCHRNDGAHALTYSSQKADTQKAQTEAIMPQPAAQNEACKENNAALKRAIVCRASTLASSFFIPIGFSV